MRTPIQHCIINYMGRESKKRTCTPKTKINPPYNILSHSTPIQTTKRECWLSSLQALVTWAAVTSLKPEQAWVPWMDCLGTEEGGEDMPANEPCPIDVVCLFPSAPAHSLQIQAGPSAVKLHLLHPKDVEPLHWKSFEKPPGFHASWWWGSHLQPPSFLWPHLWMKAPSTAWCCRNWYVSRRRVRKEGRRNGTQALGVSSGTFHSNWQSRNRTFPKALVPPVTRVGVQRCAATLKPFPTTITETFAHGHLIVTRPVGYK